DEVRIQNQRHVDFCKEADLLIHDAQYTESEYLLNRRGWGHTPIEHAIMVGRRAGVKRLALSHHDPTRPDVQLLDFQARFAALNREISPEMELFFAAEKTEIEL
ncbi:MAG: MBL fold metallo-hydrolase, partial [Myxococcota bacterium]